MMGLLKLSHQKIKAYKVRSFATIIISGIIFATALTSQLIFNNIKTTVLANTESLTSSDIEYLKTSFEKIDHNLILPAIIVLTIAAILISTFTLAHVLSEDRRTFMLYRSQGATVSQIASIYFIYVVELCFYAIVFAIILSLATSAIISLILKDTLLSSYTDFLPDSAGLPLVPVDFNYRLLIIFGAAFLPAPLALILNCDQLATKKVLRELKENS